MHKKLLSLSLSLVSLALAGVTLLSGFLLSSHLVSAEESYTDDVSINVPVACTMSGTGMNSHTATINPGTYNSAIGTTTLNVLCNDAEGFAIYAIGYTNNEDGNNTLTSTTLTTPTTIATGTGLSGNSQWAMKLATDSSATYPITLQNSFGSFHTVPDDYTLVAKRLSATDVGALATGSSLTTTYQAYISTTQVADTYSGKVKYVMVHPNAGDPPVRSDQIAVIFSGNTFEGGATRNKLMYDNVCDDAYAMEPIIVKSSNLNADGTKNSGYYYPAGKGEYYSRLLEFPGAEKIKVELRYGFTTGTGGFSIFDYYDNQRYIFYDSENNIEGTETIIINSERVYIGTEIGGESISGYDYGYYLKVTPIYYSQLYIGSTYQEVMTSNILSGGTQNGPYTDNENVLETKTLNGADMLKIVIDYGMTGDTAGLIPIEGVWDGDWNNWNDDWENNSLSSSDNVTGTAIYYIDGDTVTIYARSGGLPESGYDYGFYVRIYPVYETEQSNTTPLLNDYPAGQRCNLIKTMGVYEEPENWLESWILEENGETLSFNDESEVISYLLENRASYLGTTVYLQPYDPPRITVNFYKSIGEWFNRVVYIRECSETCNMRAIEGTYSNHPYGSEWEIDWTYVFDEFGIKNYLLENYELLKNQAINAIGVANSV